MKHTKNAILLIVINLIALFFVILQLPDIIPNHIGFDGTIDGYGSKWGLLFMAALPLLIYASANRSFFSKGAINTKINERSESIISILATLVVIIFQWIFVFIAFENKVGGSRVISFPIIQLIVFILGIFITIASNYFGTIKQNHRLGIRIPWTLIDETNWRKTHKLAGYTGFVGGLLMCIASIVSLMTNMQIYIIVGSIVGLVLFVVIPTVYSYAIYRKEVD